MSSFAVTYDPIFGARFHHLNPALAGGITVEPLHLKIIGRLPKKPSLVRRHRMGNRTPRRGRFDGR